MSRHAFFASCFALIVAGTLFGADDGLLPLTIRVVTAQGEAVHDAYVAVVPAWRPWISPLREEISENGRAQFRVPPGTYHVVAGARGHQLINDGPYAVQDAAGVTATVFLKPVAAAWGTVTDQDGRPLAGVRVADTRASIAAPFGIVSRLALQHLAGEWSTVTDSEGNWRLGVSEGKVPLVFTASGDAAQWRVASGDGKPLNVTLTPGAALRLKTDRTDADMIVTLEREGDQRPDEPPRSWQRPLWAQAARGDELTWSSLPPGRYSIFAKYADPKFFMRRAKPIGTVTVAAGEQALANVTLPAKMPAIAREVRLFLDHVHAREADVDDLDAVTLDAHGELRHLPVVVEEAVDGSIFHIAAAEERSKIELVTADSFFASAGDPAPDDVVPATVTRLRRADARLRLRPTEKTLPLPTAALAVLHDCTKRLGRVGAFARVRSDGVAELTAPAGCKNAVLSFEPFEPLTLFKQLHPGDQDLGEFVLNVAATADVHVVRDGQTAVSGATVRVFAFPADASSRDRVEVATAVSASDGWAHIEGLPAMRDLEIVATSKTGEVSLGSVARAEPRGRVVVDPLAIPKPATLTVLAKIKPEVRAEFPAARVTALLLAPIESHRSSERRTETVKNDGTPVRFEQLAPGTWRVAAWIEIAGAYDLMKVEDVVLQSGDAREVSAELEPLVFSGRVTDGGKGVAARVTLWRGGTDIVRHHLDSAADGTFHVVLPSRGTYEATAVRLDAQGDDMPLPDIDFSEPKRAVDIALPATASLVAHVRAAEKPVAGVDVSISRLRETFGTVESDRRTRSSNDRGEAAFAHLVTGEWLVTARDEATGRTAEKSVTLNAHDDAAVELELRDASAIHGTIRSEAGLPVPNAHVECLYLGANGAGERSSSNSDIDGKFSVAVPPDAPSALCTVAAPSGNVDAFKAAPRDAVELQLGAATAELRIDDWRRHYTPDGTFWLAGSDGRIVSLSAVDDVLGRFAPPLTIARLAAGRWRLVRVSSIAELTALAAGRVSGLASISDLQLVRGSRETIHLYPDAVR